MATAHRTAVKLDDLPAVMRHLTQDPIPLEVLERRRRILAEAEKVRAAMEPLSGDVKDLIREERREERLG